MSQNLNTNEAAANNCGAMEFVNHFKNGVNRINKKILSVLLAAVFTANVANAQSITVGGHEIALGARAGVNLGTFKGDKEWEDVKMKPGIQLGLVGEIALENPNLGIQLGALFTQQGCKESDSEEYTIRGVTYKTDWDYKIILNYLQIPVHLQYKHDLGDNKLLLQAGPYLGFALGGKWKESWTETDSSGDRESGSESGTFTLGNNSSNEFKKFDLGIGLGAAVSIQDKWQIGLTYNIGLSNITSHHKEETKNHGLAITLTMMFGR